MVPIKSNEPINLFYTNQDLNFFYTHPNLWVTGEFPLVADDDLRRPGSYNGFTCLDSIAISLFGNMTKEFVSTYNVFNGINTLLFFSPRSQRTLFRGTGSCR